MEHVNRLTHIIIGCAIKVHRALGPGLLESTYKKCTAYELRNAGCDVDEERALPLVYGEVRLECGYRLDLVVNELVIVEIKAVERLDPIHTAQMLTYLTLTGLPLGLLINFNTVVVKDGIKRVINTPQPVVSVSGDSPR